MLDQVTAFRLFLLALLLSVVAALGGCSYDPPPVVGARYEVLGTTTQPREEHRRPIYSCMMWDKNGWCIMEVQTGVSVDVDDEDFIVRIRQCWPKGDKKNPDAQKCIKRDLFTSRDRYEKYIDEPTRTWVVGEFDSVVDGDVHT